MSDDNFKAARSALRAKLKKGPIKVLGGGGFDRRLKREVKLNYHQSVLSAAMKDIVNCGEASQTKDERVSSQEGATTGGDSYVEITYTFIK